MIRFALVVLFRFTPLFADCVSPAGLVGQFQFNSPTYQVCDGSVWSSMAAATPTGSCTGAGLITYSAGPRFCNGSLFASMAGSETGASCSGTTTGTFQYFPALAYMQWCNGTNWKPMRAATNPIAYVQQAKVDSYTSGVSTATTGSFGGSGNVTTGNALVCYVIQSSNAQTFTSVVATGSQALTRAIGPFLIGGGAQYNAEIWYRTNITGSSATKVTATASGNASNILIICNEYSGLSSVNPLDQTAGVGNTPGTTSTAGPVSTTTAKEMLFAAGCWDRGAASVGSGYTARGTALNDCLTEDRMVTARGSYTATLGGATDTDSRGVNLMITLRANQ